MLFYMKGASFKTIPLILVFVTLKVIHPVQTDLYVFALCKDHKIRMWLASTYDCVMVADVVNVTGGAASSHAGSSRSLLHQVFISLLSLSSSDRNRDRFKRSLTNEPEKRTYQLGKNVSQAPEAIFML